MAGGPIFPHSVFPATTDEAFQNFHVGAGANSKRDEGLGVSADAGGVDVTWELRFQMPPALPTGTATLRLRVLAAAVAGAMLVDPQWASVAVDDDPSATVLNAEGNTTISWGAGDDDVYKEALITLDADTIVADEEVVMNLVFKGSDGSYDLAVVATVIPSIIWI